MPVLIESRPAPNPLAKFAAKAFAPVSKRRILPSAVGNSRLVPWVASAGQTSMSTGTADSGENCDHGTAVEVGPVSAFEVASTPAIALCEYTMTRTSDGSAISTSKSPVPHNGVVVAAISVSMTSKVFTPPKVLSISTGAPYTPLALSGSTHRVPVPPGLKEAV